MYIAALANCTGDPLNQGCRALCSISENLDQVSKYSNICDESGLLRMTESPLFIGHERNKRTLVKDDVEKHDELTLGTFC